MAQRRYELTDFEWSIIEPLLPNKPRGVPRVDDRRVLNGIYWRLRTGSPWADIPERHGPYTTCYNRFVRWRSWVCGPGYSRRFQQLKKDRSSRWTAPRSASTSTEPAQPPVWPTFEPCAWGARGAG